MTALTSRPSWVRIKRTRHPHSPVKSYRQLADAMDGGRRLVMTNTPTGPVYTLESGRVCAPAVVAGALANGWLKPCDHGLFDGLPLSWTMEVSHASYE